jgi:hypothetical protein
MPKLPIVTDAELTALHVNADDLVMEMQDYIARIDKGYVNRLESSLATARAFALIARTASELTHRLLMLTELQEQKDQLAALRKQVNG